MNEMSSSIAEDFLSNKILANGPRGVSYSDGSAGSSGNSSGRLPLFNYKNDYSLTNWVQQLYNYSTVYAYGAYISRNYGGVELFQEIVQNDPRDYSAITDALSSLGYSEDFEDTLRKWGASILLSDNLSPPSGYYQYNSGDYFDSTFDSVLYYNLGSINLYNYTYSGQTGPYIYTSSPVGSTDIEAASNRLYLVGTGLTGDVTHTVKMEDGVKLTVVVKE
jgi:hypothetical protein